jgi:hypothetical protein
MNSPMPVDVTAAAAQPLKVKESSRTFLEPERSLSFLRADVSFERSEWLQLWYEWPGRDIMAHPDYARLFARPTDQVLAAASRTRHGGILYPIILRPLAAERWAPKDSEEWDATTPYGYAGPFGWGVTAEEGALFWDRLDSWMRARRVITSFTRLPLFPEILLPFRGPVELSGPCVVRRLDLSEEDIWADYAPKVRQNVQRARRLGMTVEADPSHRRLNEFIDVYVATMNRRGAAQSYYFPRAFFQSIASDLQGHSMLFHAKSGNRVLSSELLLFSQDHAYSFLGGSLEEAFTLRANDLLKHESFMWCRRAGKKAIVLGGGYNGHDGILKYKRTFAPTGEIPFMLGKTTVDDSARDRFVQHRCEWEKARGVEWKPDPRFFPPYRS